LTSDFHPRNSKDHIDLRAIWTPELVARLRHPGPTRELLDALSTEPGSIFDLLFYSSFSDKILTVMRREGKDADGFARMQQSFRESVEKVRALVLRAGTLGFSRASHYAQLSPEGMTNMLELIHDLSVVKNWHNREA